MTPDQIGLLNRLSVSTQAALLRVARRIQEGYEGEIHLTIKGRGVAIIRWVQVETGDQFKVELIDGG